MALITCPDCGKDISDKITACIHCGCPIETNLAKTKMPSEEHTNKRDPELLPGLVDYIGNDKDPFQFKIRGAEGHHVIADKNTIISDLNEKSLVVQKEVIQIGSIVYFKQNFSEEGRLKQIFFSTDKSKSPLSNSDFKKATNFIRTSAPSLDTVQTSSENQGAQASDDQKTTKNYLMDWLLRILGVIVLGSLYIFWSDMSSKTSPDGPSKTELQITDMKKQFSTIRVPTNFKTVRFYNMTDIQRDNWEDANKRKLHLVVDSVWQVKRMTKKLTDTGGYNRYYIQLDEDLQTEVVKGATDPNYQGIGFICKSVYAYSQREATAIENLMVGKNITILAKDIKLGSLWTEADICVIKGIHK